MLLEALTVGFLNYIKHFNLKEEQNFIPGNSGRKPRGPFDYCLMEKVKFV